ncbi:hypothetical protein COS81_04965 [candidate division WWE3 bacterium CG06_land_8_20_14_3_00_42_16]|uniref:PEGA domain-containing protein n=3 Tax=Katanobacteria TaxID=422282 RepID=A0A2M7ALE1_UNCKA|nr:MAG: hypothetical protein AUJ38_03130 [bacterium CG1_02_42_9]PIU68157.1 MAG: hypothetical protein COS81_04965 [candidate division WWE3 bacterium CG06_land_8_20_14_3_00_42_16]PIZ42355.1 MAG: hypothetical protein COY34_03000 [candidate division WWE3 bacterium CG_4_10_14_0_2_um_filter_42_8]PJC69422.1 MAG: hypothetical protein CO015_00310 [candidate division WWE3 bacterium CG_4_8_14_3_um_filter_42_11]
MSKRRIFSILLITVCLVIAVIAVFLASGYSLNFKKKQIVKTGMIYATSIPDGASIFLNGDLASATNTTISNLEPGTYQIKITKNGYSTWQKDIVVRAELVSQIEALLLPSAPELKVATYDGVTKFTLSPDNIKAALAITDEAKAGVWILAFNNLPFGTGYTIKQIIKDTPEEKFSQGETVWSTDGQNVLITLLPSNSNFLLDPSHLNENPTPTKDGKETIVAGWQQEKDDLENQRKKQLTESELKIYSEGQENQWSPNSLKFLFKKDGIYFSYSLEDERLTEVKNLELASLQSIGWYPDSKHLITIEDYVEGKNGKMSVMEEDGENKTNAYEGKMDSANILVSPDGKKIFLLTSFNLSSNISSLYYLNLR